MHALAASLLSLFLLSPLASGWLGVYLSTESKEAVVAEVIPGTPAEKAGLKSGDVLLAVGDTATPTREQFIAAIKNEQSGSRVKIKVLRDQRERVVVVRLGERPENPGAGGEAPPAPHAPPAQGGAPGVEIGRVAPLREMAEAVEETVAEAAVVAEAVPQGVANKERGYLGISVREADAGLVIDRILEDGPYAKSGFAEGDVIQSIGDHRIRSLDDLDGALKKVRPGDKLVIGAVSGDAKKSLMITAGRRPGAAAEAPPANRARVVQRLEDVTEGRAQAAEAIPEASPQRAVRVVRPGRAEVVDPRSAGPAGPTRADRPARPARPARAAKPAPAPATAGEPSEYNLEQELRELRKELKELRRMLEQMRRDKNGGE